MPWVAIASTELKAGRYTLVTSADGFAAQNLAVEVPGRTPNAYDIELTAA